jgi:ABC-type sugar transport system substrate-binding protein
MAKIVAALFDQEDNCYQQLLASEAVARGTEHGITVLPPLFAGASSVVQMDQLMACTRRDPRPDAVLVVTAGPESQLPACRHAAKAGLSLVFLNRVPSFLAELRAAHPGVLITSIAPDQIEVGRIQAAQCQILAPSGGFVLLVTGTAQNASAVARKEGFLEGIGGHATVHVLDGQWSEESGFQAVRNWFRVGADRDRDLALAACQSDGMARGARRALADQARAARRAELLRVPIVGCDGLPSEGQEMVRAGEISATVVIPATTPKAIDALHAYWTRGERTDSLFLAPHSLPSLPEIRAAKTLQKSSA